MQSLWHAPVAQWTTGGLDTTVPWARSDLQAMFDPSGLASFEAILVYFTLISLCSQGLPTF